MLCFCEIKNTHSQSSIDGEKYNCRVNSKEKKRISHKLWFDRDFVRALNMTTILRLTLTGKNLGKYERSVIKEKGKTWEQVNKFQNLQGFDMPTEQTKYNQMDNEKVICKKVSFAPKRNKKILVKGKRESKTQKYKTMTCDKKNIKN